MLTREMVERRTNFFGDKYTTEYIYDSNGNLSTKTEKVNNSNLTNYTHNSLNQLIEVKNYNSGSMTSTLRLTYDSLGRRVMKSFTSNTDSSSNYIEKYGYIGTDIVSIMNDDGEVMARVTHSNIQKDLAVALHVTDKGVGKIAKQAKSYYYLRNNIGSVIDIADSTGSIVQHYIYNSYGEILDVKDGTGNSIKDDESVKTIYAFANSFYDSESELYHNSLRYYDPSTGRFIEVDPDPGHISNPRTVINKYIYSLNNPKNFRDPSGANIFEDFVNGLANSIVAVVNGLVNSIGPFIDGLGEILSSEEFRVALIVVAAVLTGGAAGAALGGGLLGALGGAAVGGLTGALTGSFHAQLSGDDPQEWLEKGFQIGFVAGGVSGYNSGFGLFDGASSGQSEFLNASWDEIGRDLLQQTRLGYNGLSCGVGAAGFAFTGAILFAAAPFTAGFSLTGFAFYGGAIGTGVAAGGSLYSLGSCFSSIF